MQTIGWLFDLYPLNDRMVLWFITESGQRLRLTDDFPYCLYLGGPPARLQSLARALGQKGLAAPGLSIPGPGFVDRPGNPGGGPGGQGLRLPAPGAGLAGDAPG